MNPPVVDCSVTAAWFLRDELCPQADGVLSRVKNVGGAAPGLWWAEFRNVLLATERSGRLTSGDVATALTEVERLDIRLDHEPRGGFVMLLARSHRLTAYDAIYLELALRQQRPLATLDRHLARAATTEGVQLV